MKYQEVLQLVKRRRSLYPQQMLENAEIEESVINQLLEVSNYAPSHKRTEPWRYIVMKGNSKEHFFEKQKAILRTTLNGNELLDQKLKKLDKRKVQVSHVIAICMSRDEKERIPVDEEEYAVACSVQNMLLSLDSLGIIGYWSTGSTAFSNEMHAFLNLREKDKCMGFLILGKPKMVIPHSEKLPITAIEQKVEKRY